VVKIFMLEASDLFLFGLSEQISFPVTRFLTTSPGRLFPVLARLRMEVQAELALRVAEVPAASSGGPVTGVAAGLSGFGRGRGGAAKAAPELVRSAAATTPAMKLKRIDLINRRSGQSSGRTAHQGHFGRVDAIIPRRWGRS
jgi:hypothetical protein